MIALSPAFAGIFSKTIVEVPHAEVLRQLLAGIEEQGVTARVIQVHDTADLAAISHLGARLSGSGISVGVLSRGTTMIHQRDLARLATWSCSRSRRCSTPRWFRQIGSNAARYAKGESPEPVPTRNDQMARPRWQAKAALLHLKEFETIEAGRGPEEVELEWWRGPTGRGRGAGPGQQSAQVERGDAGVEPGVVLDHAAVGDAAVAAGQPGDGAFDHGSVASVGLECARRWWRGSR